MTPSKRASISVEIPRDVADQSVLLGFLDERRMHPLRQFGLRKLGERTRKLRFMRNFPRALPAADPPQSHIGRQSFQQLSRRAHAERT